MMTPDTLADVSDVGPYFAVAAGPRADAGLFRPLTALYTDPAVLSAYVAEVGRRLDTVQRRVAASTLHIGIAARLWSVALATAALTGRVPDLSPDRLWWRTPDSGPIELWLPEPAALPEADVADGLYGTVVGANLRPLGEALRRDCGLSAKVLPGNAASALLGAVRVLRDRRPAAPCPPLGPATALLAREPLASSGTHGTDPLTTYRRSSCCLYYRVRGGGYCGDCVLTGPGRRSGT
ncbi:(2Fe-2S)-binding protein [Streptomyces poriticola]|uniref:(2Fe-2S)-binding protein n=1 Tax=Streptomyces poriticola TaxID=3120506 RepID=UPI002FCE3DD4